MVDGIPNRPLYFYQKDIIVQNHMTKYSLPRTMKHPPETTVDVAIKRHRQHWDSSWGHGIAL